MQKEVFMLGDYLIKPSLHVVEKADQSHRLEPKIMQVLLYLANRPGQVVSRVELLDQIWAEAIVVDVVLTRAISELRNIFQDDPYHPKYIETIPKSGYRLIAAVHSVDLDVKQKKAMPNRIWGIMVSIILLLISVSTWSIHRQEVSQNTTVRPFSNKKGWQFHPSISPDGQFATFIWFGEGASSGHIFVQSMKDQSRHRITSSPSIYLKPTWSPNGRKIYYYQNSESKVTINHLPSIGGSPEVLLQTQAQVAGLSFSPNGKALFYLDRDTVLNQHAIFQFNFLQNNIKQISQPPPDIWGDVEPQVSPNGRYLAFIRKKTEGDEDIFLIDLSTQTTHQITTLNTNIFGLNWETSGEAIIFSSNFGGATYLWKIAVKNGEAGIAQKLHFLSNEDNFQNPAIYKNKLLVENWSVEADLRYVNLIEQNDHAHFGEISSNSWELHPNLSSNDQQLVFSSKRSGYYALWLSDLSNENTTILLEDKAALNRHPAWSPQNTQIAFEKASNGQADIYLLELTSKHSIPLTDSPFDEKHPTWSRNGQYVYYTSNRNNQWEIWRQSLNHPSSETILLTKGYLAKEAYDERSFFYTKARTDGIWQFNFKDGSSKLLVPDLHHLDWGNWAPTQTGIYFIKRSKGKNQIYFYDFQLGTSRRITNLPFKVPYGDPAFAISANQRWAIIGDFKNYKGDLVLLENY